MYKRQPQKIKPWESASGETAIVCPNQKCAATTRFDGTDGWYELRVQYFDLPIGASKFRVFINQQLVDEWAAADHIPARKLDASASTRRSIKEIALRKGDEIRIEGMPGDKEPALSLIHI